MVVKTQDQDKNSLVVLVDNLTLLNNELLTCTIMYVCKTNYMFKACNKKHNKAAAPNPETNASLVSPAHIS